MIISNKMLLLVGKTLFDMKRVSFDLNVNVRLDTNESTVMTQLPDWPKNRKGLHDK